MNKRLCVVSVFLIVVGFFAGCKKDPGGTKTKIVFYNRSVSEWIPIWNKLLSEFMKSEPSITVVMENVPHREYVSKLLTMIAGQNVPDVVFLASSMAPEFASRQALVDLNSYVQIDPQFRLDDFEPISLEAFRYQKSLYALPNDVAVELMFYNKDLFDAADLAYPKPGWNWDDFVSIGKKLTVRKGDRVVLFAYVPFQSWGFWKNWMWSNGADVVDDPKNPRKATFNSPESIQTFQFLHDLIFKYRIGPLPAEAVQDMNPFFMQKAAMMIGGHWNVPQIKKYCKFRWGMVEVPARKKQGTKGDCSGYAILAQSKNKEAAWKLVKFMSGFQAQKIFAKEDFLTPALKSIARDPEFLTFENRKLFSELIRYGKHTPRMANWHEVEEMINKNLDLLWLGKKTPKEICNEINAKIQSYLEKGKKR